MAEGHAPISHVFYADGVTPICEDKVKIPDNPIRFADYEGEPCAKCDTKLTGWLMWWQNTRTYNDIDSGRMLR